MDTKIDYPPSKIISPSLSFITFSTFNLFYLSQIDYFWDINNLINFFSRDIYDSQTGR